MALSSDMNPNHLLQLETGAKLNLTFLYATPAIYANVLFISGCNVTLGKSKYNLLLETSGKGRRMYGTSYCIPFTC